MRISDGEDSANGCNGGTDKECDSGAPSMAGDHKALTVCALPVKGSTQRPPGERSMHPHGFRRDREESGYPTGSFDEALVVESAVRGGSTRELTGRSPDGTGQSVSDGNPQCGTVYL